MNYNVLKGVDLIEWRLKNKVSQKDLAGILRIHVSTLWRYEHDLLKIPTYLHYALSGIEKMMFKVE